MANTQKVFGDFTVILHLIIINALMKECLTLNLEGKAALEKMAVLPGGTTQGKVRQTGRDLHMCPQYISIHLNVGSPAPISHLGSSGVLGRKNKESKKERISGNTHTDKDTIKRLLRNQLPQDILEALLRFIRTLYHIDIP